MQKYIVSYQELTLNFKFPAATSRGVLREKTSFILSLRKIEDPSKEGFGEASLISGLSPDHIAHLKYTLAKWEDKIIDDENLLIESKDLPALHLAVEMALLNLNYQDPNVYFNNKFTQSQSYLLTNGLIWMNTLESMQQQIQEKINQGFKCIKFKIAKETLTQDLKLLAWVREKFPKDITLRLDANGSFSFAEIFGVLDSLHPYNIEYIEQPIAPSKMQPSELKNMQKVCKESPIPIALDEELIGITQKEELLSTLLPQYLILKPSLLGGFQNSLKWINNCKAKGIQYRITSALESNVGLNAIAQFTAEYADITQHHGLGTGALYTNNTVSSLKMSGEKLYFNQA